LHSAGPNPAHDYSARLGGLPHVAGRKADWASAWWPSPAVEAARALTPLHAVVGQNPPTGVDRQHESREARSLYPSALHLACALRLKFVGRAT
jgi:hypothetical protein